MNITLVLQESCKSWDVDRGWCESKER